jgi:hypothetical protein
MEFTGIVSSLGLFCEKERQFLLLVNSVKKQPLKFFFLPLDGTSSAMVSPFFEHSVTLLEGECCGEVPTLLYTLGKWHSQQFRIPSTVTDPQKYTGLVREIIRRTFFPHMIKPPMGGGTQPWQREIFNWHTFRHGMATRYSKEFSLSTWLAKELTGNKFWKEFLLKGLGLNCKTLMPHDMPQLYGLLNEWREYRHIAGYLKYRFLDMEVAHRVSVCGIGEVKHANLSMERLRDLDTLYRFAARPTQQHTYKDFNLMIGQTVRPSAMQVVVDHFHKTLKRETIVENLIIRKIVSETERQARLSPSTVYPVSVKNVLYHYTRMFGLPSPSNTTTTIHEHAEDVPTVETLVFDHSHGEEIVNRVVKALSSPQKYPYSELPWHCIQEPFTGSVALKPNATLLYVAAKEETNREEEALHKLCSETLRCLCETHDRPSSWDYLAEQRRYDSLDDIDRSLYDLRITALLYKPVEMALGDDVALLHKLMWENIFSCSVVRPRGSDYSLRKVWRYFVQKGEISMEDLHTRFSQPETASAKELVVVMDCHLFSVRALLDLFQWFYRHRTTVRRLIMMGASDTLPLTTDGQAWIDLLTAYGYETPLFGHAELNASLDRLVETAVEERRMVLVGEREDLEGRLSTRLRRREKRPDLVFLHCLVSVEESLLRLPPAGSLQDRLEEAITLAYRSNHNVRISRVTVAQLSTLPLSRDRPGTRHSCHLFFITQRHMKLLTRNEINHLLLELPPEEEESLTVLCESSSPGSLGWLRKAPSSHPLFPNSRFTMAYLRRVAPLRGEARRDENCLSSV